MVTSYPERHRAFRDAITAAHTALGKAEAAEEAYYALISKPHQPKAWMAAQTEQQLAAARVRVLENCQQVGVHLIDAIHAWWRHLDAVASRDEPRDTIADDPGPLLPGPWDAA